MDDVQLQIDELKQMLDKTSRELSAMKEASSVQPMVQLRNPLDPMSRRTIENLINYPITINLESTLPATATNYGVFFTADKPYNVISVVELHAVAGSDAGAVTLQIERLQGTEALDAGDEILNSSISLKGTANTVVYPTLKNTGVTVLSRGDRLALKDAGTLTAVAGLQVTVYLQTL